MKDYKFKFIKHSLSKNVLNFGNFILKSGRISPYIFNLSYFNNSDDLNLLGKIYAKTLIKSGIKFDLIFGPAYKGISIVIITTYFLLKKYKLNIEYFFNQKEKLYKIKYKKNLAKSFKKRVVIVDDVITSGNTIHESIKIINNNNWELVGIIVSFDRRERGYEKKLSAIQEIEKIYCCKIISIINFEDLINYIKINNKFLGYLSILKKYKNLYGV